MNLALSHPTTETLALEGQPERAWPARHALAVRDLRDTAALWRLCWTLGWLDIKLRYRGSMLGPFWLTLSTALMVGSMGVLYATLFKMNLHEYLPFLALSLVLWNFLSALVGDACASFTQVEGMIRSIRMPFTLYGARVVLRNVMVLGHNLVVIVVVDAALRAYPGIMALMALPGIVLWLLDGLAIAMLLGALCARFRDIPPIVASLMQIAFFMTPVIWKPELLHAHQWVLVFNPFFSLLEVVRGPLQGAAPDLGIWVSALGFSGLLCGIAWVFFVRVRGRIAFWL